MKLARDIRVVKYFVQRKQYSHSAYHLQQAAEKAIKGYVLLEGFYKSNELKRFDNFTKALLLP